MPQQYTLAIEHPHEQRLDNFVVGANGELLQLLRSVDEGFAGYWIFGAVSSGRSHLLRGACLQAQKHGTACVYIGCADFADDDEGLAAALTHAGEHGRVVALDDLGWIAGRARFEELLLTVYQRLFDARGRLLIAHTRPASTLAFETPDLGSRLRSLQHFEIKPLDDAGKARLLQQRARNRGYALSQPVLDYWMARGPRDLGALLADLNVLDQASLAQQQRVTIPLLKQVLGY